MSDPNQSALPPCETNPREKLIYKAVGLLADAAFRAEKSNERERYRLHILELLEPRGDCEYTVSMLLRTQVAYLRNVEDSESYQILRDVLDVLEGSS